MATTHSTYAHPDPHAIPIPMSTLLLGEAVGSLSVAFRMRWALAMFEVRWSGQRPTTAKLSRPGSRRLTNPNHPTGDGIGSHEPL